MKTSKKICLLILPLLALLFSSCEKDMDNKVTLSNSNNTIAEIESFLTSNAPIKQTFQLNAASYNTIRGAKGTSITIPSNAFVDANGNPVSGSFTFELQEIFSPADMIFTGKMTSSGGRTLASGGEMYINASQGGNDLQLASGQSLDISVPTCSYDSQMDLFVGNGQNDDNFDWVPETNSLVYPCQDSLNPCKTNYCFNISDLFNWINCDYFYNDPRPLTEVEIQVPSGYDNQNTQVYTYIPSISSVTSTSFQNGSFWIKSGYRLPVGLAVTFVGLHSNGTDLHYSIQNAIIVNNHVEVLSFQKVTAAQLTKLLKNL